MEQLEQLALWMMAHSDNYNRAMQREQNYAAARASELKISVDEFIRRDRDRKLRTMHEECVFGENEDIIIFAENLALFGAGNHNVEQLRHSCLEGYCHRHEFFEMFYVLRGSCYNYIDGTEELLPEGSICLYNRQSVHERVLSDDTSILLTLCVRRQAFETYLLEMLRCLPTLWQFFAGSMRNDDEPPMHIRVDAPPGSELESLLYQILRAYLLNDEASQTVMKCQFLCLLAELARMKNISGYRMEPSAPAVERNETVDYILGAIHAHCDSVTLSGLADSCHYSAAYLSRLIKQKTGKNFQELKNACWLEKAKALLSCTTLPVEDIAELMGASARSNFERRFRSLCELSPVQYRQSKLRHT